MVREGSLRGRPFLTSTSKSMEVVKQYWRENPSPDQECGIVFCLTTKYQVSAVIKVSMGILDGAMLHPREVFRPAILEGSSAIIISHNHPSGLLEVSMQDIDITKRLNDAGKILGINLLDHIIYADGEDQCKSLAEEGYISRD